VARESGVRDKRSKRFWSLLLAFWVVFGVVSLIGQLWWTAASAAGFFMVAVVARRNAPDKPR
jgi:lysylphosphatidylglycerol synthetase-like protein (DUF2156 family)